MDPETFLLPDEIRKLVNVLKDFVERHGRNALKQALKLNDMDVSQLTFPESPPNYAQEVVLAWKEARVSEKRPGGYHPLVSVVGYLLKVYQWNNEEQKQLLNDLLKRGGDNLKALEVCKAVGRIECPLGKGIGTAVLLGLDRVLTCRHVFKDLVEAWVRFGHQSSEGEKNNEKCLSLDFSKITFSHQGLDFAIVTIDEQLGYEFVRFNSQKPHVDDSVRIIHHSQGEPLKISSLGKITKVENGLLDHKINNVGPGASGAPIFNEDWEVIGLHQGRFRGITLNAVQNEVVTLFSSGEKNQRQDSLQVNCTSTIEQQSFVEQIENWLREREVVRISDKVEQASVKIELDFLGYGLDIEMAKFQNALISAQGAFAFEIHGDSELIEKYVIEKILRALQHKIGGRIYSKKEINLYAEDIENIREGGALPGLEVIEHRIKVEKQVDGIVEFLLDIPKSQDIVFIIWCKSPLSQRMKSVAQTFWTSVGSEVWPVLIDRGRRLVVIWVTPDTRKRESIGKPFTAVKR